MSLYRKLALSGLRRNKPLYIPYLISGAGTAALYYILRFLAGSDAVSAIKGGAPVTQLLAYAARAVALFSVPFLFYANAALVKRRGRELGLYSVLGMNRRGMARVLALEALMVFAIAVGGGLVCGVALSKAAELGLMNIMGQDIDYRLQIDWNAALSAMALYFGIYALILLNTLRRVGRARPIELLRSESEGERPPRARGGLAALGILCLAIGYGMAMSTESALPRMALSNAQLTGVMAKWLLASVSAIAAGTYLLFIFASVALCKRLQQNRRFYYQSRHFFTVSAMAFRMKRNGAGLASICALITAALMMFSVTVSFYVGVRTVVARKYPCDCGAMLEIPPTRMAEQLRTGTLSGACLDAFHEALSGAGIDSFEETAFETMSLFGFIRDGQLDLSVDTRAVWNGIQSFSYFNRHELPQGEEIAFVRIMSMEDYLALGGVEASLPDSELLIACRRGEYSAEDIILPDGSPYRVGAITDALPAVPTLEMFDRDPTTDDAKLLYLVTEDLPGFMERAYGLLERPEQSFLLYRWEWGVDLPGNADRAEEARQLVADALQAFAGKTGLDTFASYSRGERTDNAAVITGGLMFIMILLNLLLCFATALIMYYKQVTEGCEDQKRFIIMRKVGMTTGEIRRSIRAQLIWVFGAPLGVAAVHLVFTFGLIHYLLRYALMNDRPLLIRSMLASFALFAVVYAAMHALTSRTYFNIVSRAE